MRWNIFVAADDMGLGKTLTMISLILAERASKDTLESQKEVEWFKKDSQKKSKLINGQLLKIQICT